MMSSLGDRDLPHAKNRGVLLIYIQNLILPRKYGSIEIIGWFVSFSLKARNIAIEEKEQPEVQSELTELLQQLQRVPAYLT